MSMSSVPTHIPSSTATIKSSLDAVTILHRWVDKYSDPSKPIQESDIALLLKNNITPDNFCQVITPEHIAEMKKMGFVPGARMALLKARERILAMGRTSNRPEFFEIEDMNRIIAKAMPAQFLQQAYEVFVKHRSLFDDSQNSEVTSPSNTDSSSESRCPICCGRTLRHSHSEDQTATTGLLMERTRIITDKALCHDIAKTVPDFSYDSPSNFVSLCTWCSEHFTKHEIALVPAFTGSSRAFVLTSLRLPINVHSETDLGIDEDPSSPQIETPTAQTILDKRYQFHDPIPVPGRSLFQCPYCSKTLSSRGNVVSHYFACASFRERLREVGITKILDDPNACPYCRKPLAGGVGAVGKHYPRCEQFVCFVKAVVRFEFGNSEPTPPLFGRVVEVNLQHVDPFNDSRHAALRFHSAFCLFLEQVTLHPGMIITYVLDQMSRDLKKKVDEEVESKICWSTDNDNDDEEETGISLGGTDDDDEQSDVLIVGPIV